MKIHFTRNKVNHKNNKPVRKDINIPRDKGIWHKIIIKNNTKMKGVKLRKSNRLMIFPGKVVLMNIVWNLQIAMILN